MGSLTAGWDSSHVGDTPKELLDYENGEKARGYFAKLEERKLEKRASLEHHDPIGEAPSLAGTSFKRICHLDADVPEVPPKMVPSKPSLHRASVPSTAGTSRQSGSGTLDRKSMPSMVGTHGGYALDRALSSGHKYNFTDWEHELSSLGGVEKRSSWHSPPVEIPVERRGSGGWWSQTDSGQNLFQAAGAQEVEEDATARKKGSSFSPQYLTPSSLPGMSPKTQGAK